MYKNSKELQKWKMNYMQSSKIFNEDELSIFKIWIHVNNIKVAIHIYQADSPPFVWSYIWSGDLWN